MKQVKRLIVRILFYLLFIYFPFSVSAQETTSASGNSVESAGGSVSYTVGQVVSSAVTTPDGSVYQGVQQAYEIYDVTGNDLVIDVQFTCSVFPNPTEHTLLLKFESENLNNCYFELYSLEGKRILDDEINSTITSIDVAGLKPATYYLRILSGQNIIKIFQIIKN
jgi:hypothetical protein